MKQDLAVGQTFSPYRVFHGIYIPEQLAEYPGLSSGAKLVWGALSKFAGRDSYSYPSMNTLAQKTGQSRQSVFNQIAELKKQGFIRIEASPTHTSHRYYFLWHEVFDKKPTTTEADEEGCQKSLQPSYEENKQGGCKKSLQPIAPEKTQTACQKSLQPPLVKNIDTPCQQTLQGCKKTVHNLNQEKNQLKESEKTIVPVELIISDLNSKAKTNYQPTTEPYRKAIQARWKELKGTPEERLEQFIHVHTVVCQEWLGNHDMERHLSPDTIYRPSKFPKYLQWKVREKTRIEGAPEEERDDPTDLIFEQNGYVPIDPGLWQQVLVVLESNISQENMDTWFRSIEGYYSPSTQNQIILTTSTKYHRDWIHSHFRPILQEAFGGITGKPVKVTIKIRGIE